MDNRDQLGRHTGRQGQSDSDQGAPAGLTDADRARIRAEEEYRAQVRREVGGQDAGTPGPAPRPAQPPTGPRKPPPTMKEQLQSGGILAAVMLLTILGAWTYFSRTGSPGLTGVANAVSGEYRYEVTASCPVDLTYTTASGTEQVSRASSSWSQAVSGVGVPQVMAQLTCAGGSVTARILNGGRVYKEATSRGNYAIAHAHP